MTRILIAEDEARIVSFLEKGLRAAGFSVNPEYSTGITGKSSGRQKCVGPKVCHSTMSSFSIGRFCATYFGRPSPPACWLGNSPLA